MNTHPLLKPHFNLNPPPHSGAGASPPPSPPVAAATRAAFDKMVDYRHRSEKRHSGMWRDIAVRKRKTEVNQLLVPMAEEADTQGVPVPLNKRMIELVYDIEEGRRPQSWDNLKVLEAEIGRE